MRRIVDGEARLSETFPIPVGDEVLRQPEARMWAVCLSQGICGAIGLVRCHAVRNYRSRDRYWLFRDKRETVGSCQWICDLLEIDRKELLTFVWRNRWVLKREPYRLRSIS